MKKTIAQKIASQFKTGDVWENSKGESLQEVCKKFDGSKSFECEKKEIVVYEFNDDSALVLAGACWDFRAEGCEKACMAGNHKTCLCTKISDAKDLTELLGALQEHDDFHDDFDRDDIDTTDLPTFGGEEPTDTSGIWSWDEKSLLVGTCIADMEIIDRPTAADYEVWTDQSGESEVLEGDPTGDLVRESLAVGTGHVLARLNSDGCWDFVDQSRKSEGDVVVWVQKY